MTYIFADPIIEADMAQRKLANLIKGLAWLLLAAALLPTFSSGHTPAGEVTVLTLGLPWSPWLVYRESWSGAKSAEAGAAGFGYRASVQPRCWSVACLGAGLALSALSRPLRPTPPLATSPLRLRRKKSTVYGA